jgi:hypothetical protein
VRIAIVSCFLSLFTFTFTLGGIMSAEWSIENDNGNYQFEIGPFYECKKHRLLGKDTRHCNHVNHPDGPCMNWAKLCNYGTTIDSNVGNVSLPDRHGYGDMHNYVQLDLEELCVARQKFCGPNIRATHGVFSALAAIALVLVFIGGCCTVPIGVRKQVIGGAAIVCFLASIFGITSMGLWLDMQSHLRAATPECQTDTCPHFGSCIYLTSMAWVIIFVTGVLLSLSARMVSGLRSSSHSHPSYDLRSLLFWLYISWYLNPLSLPQMYDAHSNESSNPPRTERKALMKGSINSTPSASPADASLLATTAV